MLTLFAALVCAYLRVAVSQVQTNLTLASAPRNESPTLRRAAAVGHGPASARRAVPVGKLLAAADCSAAEIKHVTADPSRRKVGLTGVVNIFRSTTSDGRVDDPPVVEPTEVD
jgi:hypothetical protein